METKELLNKGCQIKCENTILYCYNITGEMMHFVKCGKKGQLLSPKGKNLVNFYKSDIVKNIDTYKTITLEVGNIC